MVFALLLALVLSSPAPPAAAGGPEGPCPVQGKPACVVTLAGAAGPGASAACGAAGWSDLLRFTLPERFADSNRDGVFETVVEIRLDPLRTCGCARLKVFYDAAPSDWTVDVGNSPTNDGHGGDQGTTPESAELQVLERKLTVYAASRRQQVDRLFEARLPPLGHGVLALEICDQTLAARFTPARRGAEPLELALGTVNAKLLLSFGSEPGAAPAERASLYAAFNRVIHRASGAPSHARTGTGVRRVEIELSP